MRCRRSAATAACGAQLTAWSGHRLLLSHEFASNASRRQDCLRFVAVDGKHPRIGVPSGHLGPIEDGGLTHRLLGDSYRAFALELRKILGFTGSRRRPHETSSRGDSSDSDPPGRDLDSTITCSPGSGRGALQDSPR
jgi:hypothetical protein